MTISTYPPLTIWGNRTDNPDLVTNLKLNNSQDHLTGRIDLEAALSRQFAVDPFTTSFLTLGYLGGVVGTVELPIVVPAGTVALEPLATNMVMVHRGSGLVTTGAEVAEGCIPLHRLVCNSSQITEWTDLRSWTFPGTPGQNGTDGVPGVGVPEGGATGQVLAKESAADHDTFWWQPTDLLDRVLCAGGEVLVAGENLVYA